MQQSLINLKDNLNKATTSYTMNEADNYEKDQVSSLEEAFKELVQPNHPFDETSEDQDEDREVGLEQDTGKECTYSDSSFTQFGGAQQNSSEPKGVTFNPEVTVSIIQKLEDPAPLPQRAQPAPQRY